MELKTGFQTELSWKIFLDRYTMKDPQRDFKVGDLVIALVEPHPKWPKKDVGEVKALLDNDYLSIELITGPQKGEIIERRHTECDRPLETTIHEVASRIAKGVAAVEQPKVRQDVEESFAREIAGLRFVPGGRIWAGAGTGQKLTYFNCYVLPCPKDSRHGIVETLGQMIEIMSRGGGVGINISSLRPHRAIVRGVNGRSSGAVSWMDLFSRATGLVEQGGSRRGALMLQIEDWHPDVWRFIEVKKTPGMVENANISVRISDRFMEAVKADGDWDLVFPDTSDPDYDELWDGNLEHWQERGKSVIQYETVKAKKLWQAIVEGAWQAAEPGIVFDERHEKDSNSWYFNPLISTNPCVTGDTLIATNGGLCRADDLYHANIPIAVVVDERFEAGSSRPASAVFMTGIKPVVQVRTREGYRVRVTRDHQIYSDRRGWVPAADLGIGEFIRVRQQAGGFGRAGSLVEGWSLGSRILGEDEVAGVPMRHGGGEHREDGASQATKYVCAQGQRVPALVLQGSEDMQRGFLQALYEHCGSMEVFDNTLALTLPRQLLGDVQQLLLNFGVFSRIRDAWALLPQDNSSTLTISGPGIARFQEHIGFLSPEKRQSLPGSPALDWSQTDWLAEVVEVVDDGVEAVYDLTEPVTHAFSANGLVVHNCAEQPLQEWGV